jgi:hypothetical protein
MPNTLFLDPEVEGNHLLLILNAEKLYFSLSGLVRHYSSGKDIRSIQYSLLIYIIVHGVSSRFSYSWYTFNVITATEWQALSSKLRFTVSIILYALIRGYIVHKKLNRVCMRNTELHQPE